MTEAHCVGCGRPLQADDAICPFCAQQLDPDPAPQPKPYRCPACGEWMERPHAAAWPPDAKWYRYTRLRDQCPHCQAWLRDRRDWLATPEAFALWAFSLVRPAWAHSCGCKSRRKLITANEAKRNCVATERGA